jgi:hypothetical protein
MVKNFYRLNLPLLLLSATGLLPYPSMSQSVFPGNSEAYPVLIQIGMTSGSGVFLENTNHRVFLITARHVLFQETFVYPGVLVAENAGCISRPTGISDESTNSIILNLESLRRRGQVKVDRWHDVAVVCIGTNSYPTNVFGSITTFDDVIEAHASKTGLMIMSTSMTRRSKDIDIGTDTYMFGFPLQLRLSDVNQIDFRYPLIRKGIVAQKNRQNETLIIDSGSFGGNSGGPVFVASHPFLNVTQFQLCGLVVEYVPFLPKPVPGKPPLDLTFGNSGYAVVEPIEFAIDLMNQ